MRSRSLRTAPKISQLAQHRSGIRKAARLNHQRPGSIAPGAIFAASLDKNYFMSYGFERDTLAVPLNTDLFLRPSKEGANVITFPKDVARLSGFIWPRNTAQ